MLADPVFSADDPRVGHRRGRWQATAAQYAASGDSVRSGAGLSAAGVCEAPLQPQGSRRNRAADAAGYDTEGSRFRCEPRYRQSAGLGQYRIVHFATHSVLNNQHPELSGVVLSLVDRVGTPAERISSALRYLQLAARRRSGRPQRMPDRARRRDQGRRPDWPHPRVSSMPARRAWWRRCGRSTTALPRKLMKRFYEGMLAPGRRRPRH